MIGRQERAEEADLDPSGGSFVLPPDHEHLVAWMEEVRGAIQPVANCAAAQAHDTSATATGETGGTKSILRLIRSTPASNPETGALRAEVEGLRLALSIVQEALREERSDKEHWRDEAKQLRQLLSRQKPEPKIINVAAPEAPHTVEAPTLAPALETEPEKRPSSEMTSADSAAPAPQR